MTREDFIKEVGRALSVEALTDVYVKAGMLKLDEPQSATDRFCDAYHGEGSTRSLGPQIQAALDRAGLRIVEK
jgi:hypothetical protein